MCTLTFQVLGQDYLGEWYKDNLYTFIGSLEHASHFQKVLKGSILNKIILHVKELIT